MRWQPTIGSSHSHTTCLFFNRYNIPYRVFLPCLAGNMPRTTKRAAARAPQRTRKSTQRRSYHLVTATFVPMLHPLAPASAAPQASTHMNAVVNWYRQRLRDYEYCAWSDPALRKEARRCLRVKRMPRGRLAVIYPVPIDAHRDDVHV